MTFIKTVLSLSAAITLTACLFETPEQKVSRATQFHGKTLAQVSQIIGPPTEQAPNTAIWFFDKTVTIKEPIEEKRGRRNRIVVVGTYDDITTFKCTYTATLVNDRIASSVYKGNSCKRFSPYVDR